MIHSTQPMQQSLIVFIRTFLLCYNIKVKAKVFKLTFALDFKDIQPVNFKMLCTAVGLLLCFLFQANSMVKIMALFLYSVNDYEHI